MLGNIGCQESAIESTARQTQKLMGSEFGEGLYFNSLFLLVWIADVLFWWINPERYERRPAWVEYGIHGYLFFIAINGAVIFESGVNRILAIASMAGKRTAFAINLITPADLSPSRSQRGSM